MSSTKNKINLESGFTLIEVSIALILIASVIAGIFAFMQSGNRELELRNDAKKLNVITDAAKDYVLIQRENASNSSNAGTLLPGVNDSSLSISEVPLELWSLYLPEGTGISISQKDSESYSVRLFSRNFRTIPASPTSVSYPLAFLVFTSNETPYNTLDGEKLSTFSKYLVKYITANDTSASTITGPNNSWSITKPANLTLRAGDYVVPIFLPPLLEKTDNYTGLESFRGKEWRQLADPTYYRPERRCTFWLIWCFNWVTVQVPVTFPPSNYVPSYPMVASVLSIVPTTSLIGKFGIPGAPSLSMGLVNIAHQTVREVTINFGRDNGFHTSARVIGFDPQNGPDRGSMVRKVGVNYTNDTGMPIMISVTANHEDSMTKAHCSGPFDCMWMEMQYLTGRRDNSSLRLTVDGITIATESIIDSSGSMISPIEAIIPPNSTYRVDTHYSRLVSWAELR
ncbi:TPA: type II secretion system protein [Enterobacter asburiae]